MVVPKLFDSLLPSASYSNVTSSPSGRTTFASEPSAFHLYFQCSFFPSCSSRQLLRLRRSLGTHVERIDRRGHTGGRVRLRALQYSLHLRPYTDLQVSTHTIEITHVRHTNFKILHYLELTFYLFNSFIYLF